MHKEKENNKCFMFTPTVLGNGGEILALSLSLSAYGSLSYARTRVRAPV